MNRLLHSGAITGYRERVYDLIRTVVLQAGVRGRALDVGAGEGWFAWRLQQDSVLQEVLPVDIERRAHEYVKVTAYDGRRLPLADRSVDLSYAVDVVHHSESPRALLEEMMRVSRRWLLLKDHTWSSLAGRWTLALLDEVGNRRFGIPSPGRYQRHREWLEFLEASGFAIRVLIHPAPCHEGLLGALTNRLQMIVLAERIYAS